VAKDKGGYAPGILDDVDPDQEPIADGGLFSDLDPAARPARDAAFQADQRQRRAEKDAEFYGLNDDYTGTRTAKGGVLRGAMAIAGTVGTLAGNVIPGRAGDELYDAGKSAFEEGDAVGAAQREGRAQMEAKGIPSVESPRTEENVSGVISGLTQAAPALAVGPWTSILSSAATAGAQAEHEADAAGMTGWDKAAYAGSIAGINGAVAGVFQKFGLGGKEAASVGAKLIDQSFTRALVHAGVQSTAEGVQNVMIAAGTKVARKLAGTDATPDDWSRELEDTFLQGLAVSGVMHAATLGGNALDMGQEAWNEHQAVRDADRLVLGGDLTGQPLDAQAQQGAALDAQLPQRAGVALEGPQGVRTFNEDALNPEAGPPVPAAPRSPQEYAQALQDLGHNASVVEPSVDPNEPVHRDDLPHGELSRAEMDDLIRSLGSEPRARSFDRNKTVTLDISREPTVGMEDAALADARGIDPEAPTDRIERGDGTRGTEFQRREPGNGFDQPAREPSGIFDDLLPKAEPPAAAAPATPAAEPPSLADVVGDGESPLRQPEPLPPRPDAGFLPKERDPAIRDQTNLLDEAAGKPPAEPAAEPVAAPKPAPPAPAGRAVAHHDIIDQVIERGGIRPKPKGYAGGEYDDLPKLTGKARKALAGREAPDVMAKALHDEGVGDGSVRTLAKLIEDAHKARQADAIERAKGGKAKPTAEPEPAPAPEAQPRPRSPTEQRIADELDANEFQHLGQTAKGEADGGGTGRARGEGGVARPDEAAADVAGKATDAPGRVAPADALVGKGDSAAPADRVAKPGAVPEPAESAAPAPTEPEVHPEERAILDELNAKGGPPAKRIEPDPIQGPVKKHQEAILDLSQGVERSIFQGRKWVSKGRGVLGTYFPGMVKTTIRHHGDLDVTAHEVGHMLDDRFGIVGKWAGRRQRSPYDAELIPRFSSTGSKGTTLAYTRAEGVAEYLRAWMVNPKAAEAAAPKFTAWMKEQIPPKILAKLRAFGDNIRAFAGKPAIEGISANVQHFGEHPEVRRTLTRKLAELMANKGMVFKTGALDKLRAEVQDQLWPVMKGISAAVEYRGMNPEIGGKGGLLPANDPRIAIRLLSGMRDGMMLMLDKGPLDLHGNGRTPGGVGWLWEPARPGRIQEDLKLGENYAIAQRIKWEADKIDTATAAKIAEMQKAGASASAIAGVLMSAREAKSHIAGIGGGVFRDHEMAAKAISEVDAMDQATRTAVGELGARLRQWNHANLDHLVDMGMLTKADRDSIVKENPYYVDFRRVFPEVDDESPSRTGVGNPLAKRVGSTRQLDDPYVNTLAMTEKIHRMAARNAALRAFTDLLDNTRGMYQGDATPFAEIGRKVPPEERRDGDGAIAIKRIEKGEVVTEHWQFQKDVQKALERWSTVNDDGSFMKALMVPAKIARWGVVHGPSFILRNIQRDAIARGVLSRTGSTPWDQFRPYSHADYERFRAFGGGQAGHYLTDKVNYHKELAKRLRQLTGDKGSVLAMPGRIAKGAWHFYEDKVAQGSELVGRMAEFNRAYKHAKAKLGYDDRNANLYAAYQSRDLLDYAVAGHFTRQIAKFIPFFNANIQGLARTARGAAENPAKFAAKWGAYVVAPTLATYAWNNRDDESSKRYRQLPAWRRDMFWNVDIGPDLWLTLPKPFELGAIASGFERMLDQSKGDPHAWDGYPTSLRQALIPVGQDTLAGPMAPALELLTNKDFFSGKDIVPSYEAGKDMSLRPGAERASRIGQGVAHILGADPRQVDQFVNSALGNVGKLALQAGDIGRGDDKDTLTSWARTLSGITSSDPSWNARDVEAVMTEAIRRGEEQSKPVMRLRGMLKLASATKDEKERAKLKAEAVDYATALRAAYDETPYEELPATPTKKELRGKLDKAQITGKPEDRAAAVDLAKAKAKDLVAETKASTTAKALEKTRLMLATIDARKDLTDAQRAVLRRALERRLAELRK
jgi:hypothetical protein